jgi:phosphatidylinositol alpha-mannosyltransferase
MSGMRIALVSPYSWSYPGGVTRHIEALAEQFVAGGHHVRVLSPYDPPDRLSARMHRGARPEARELQDWVIPLGRTIGVKSNGAVSNLPHTPFAITMLPWFAYNYVYLGRVTMSALRWNDGHCPRSGTCP